MAGWLKHGEVIGSATLEISFSAKSPPRGYRGGQCRLRSADRIDSITFFRFVRFGFQAEFFGECPGKKAAHRVRLPTCRLHQLRQSGSARPFEQRDHFGGLAPWTGRASARFGRRFALLFRAVPRGRLRRCRHQAQPSSSTVRVGRRSRW